MMQRNSRLILAYIKLALLVFLLTELIFSAHHFVIYQFLALVGVLEFLRLRPVSGSNTKVKRWLEQTYSQTLKQPFISHRGQNPDAPANTLAAFKLALDKGANALEMDLRLSKDGEIVLIHDPVVDTTTDQHGLVKDFTVSELKGLAVTKSAPVDFSDEECRIPTLKEVLNALYVSDASDKYAATKLILDVKDSSNQMAEELTKLFRQYTMLYDHAVVAGFNPLLLYRIRRMDCNIMVGLTFRPDIWTKKISPDADNWLALTLFSILDAVTVWAQDNLIWAIVGNSFCLMHKDFMSASAVAKWRGRDIEPIFWTVDDTIEKTFCSNPRGLNCAFISNHT